MKRVQFICWCMGLVLISLPVTLLAQQPLTISGVVGNAEDKKPLPFAYVIIKNVKLGTVTDPDGRFKITVPPEHQNGKIQFSYTGFKTTEVSIASIPNKQSVAVWLTPEVKLLGEVLVKAQREYTPKELLKKVLDRIPENYGNADVNMDGYYRETLRENNGYIKYADAACRFHYSAYRDQKLKWRDFTNPYFATGSLSRLSPNWGERLHRGHFRHRTLKEDAVQIIDSRASANLTRKNMMANIEGGPMSLLGNDLVKLRDYFLDKGNFSNYEYTLAEELDSASNEWRYVLSFERKVDFEKLNSDSKKKWRYRYKIQSNMFSGRLYIHRQSLAVVKMEYFVPPNLKEYICGYEKMAIKHFDYNVTVEYRQHNSRWYPFYVLQDDEFIIDDTVARTITPFRARSELFIHQIKTDSVKKIAPEDAFANVDYNQLYDYPVEYDSAFWATYLNAFPQYSIPADVRLDMETDKSLETQFADKQKKDESLLAPVAKKEPSEYRLHGETVTDEYAWLKDTRAPRSNAAVMDYLTAENNYADNYFIPLRKSQRNIFSELVSRVEKNFESLPREENGYLYYYRYQADDEYPRYFRKAKVEGVEQLILDVNELASGKEFYSAGGITVSPDTRIAAFYENTDGSNRYTIKFKDLATGLMLPDSLQNATDLVWAGNNVVFYTAQQPKTDRSYRLMKHRLGQAQPEDVLLAEEADERFSLVISRSRSREFVFLTALSKTTTEVRFVSLKNPEGNWRIIHPREENHRYEVDHVGKHFYIATNKGAPNFRVVITDTAAFTSRHWRNFIEHRKDVLLESMVIFDHYYVLGERANAQTRIRVGNLSTREEKIIKTNEEVCEVGIGYNPLTATDTLQYSYSSFTEPATVFHYNLKTGQQRVVKKQEVPFKPWMRSIKVERVWVTAKDGAQIPLTLVYNKYIESVRTTTNKRVYLTAYGAYGSSMSAGFNTTIFSWLDRNFVYAIAHVRGGSDMGMHWYENGKLMNKRNTFDDFIACADYLVAEKYVESGNIVAQGGSAGGLLMGAVVNMRPELFKAVILDVPFVDVVNTMLDESLPLTTLEYDEWGNPNQKKAYEYLKSYSPYDNIRPQAYPNIFFFTGLNDRNVPYWEAAKMVARLRANNTGPNTILLRTDFNSGHGGGSGRYDGFRELAYKMALVFDLFEKSRTTMKPPTP
jgi:protease II